MMRTVAYAHQFFAEWDLEQEHLNIFSEYEKRVSLIEQVSFRLNI